MAGDELIASGPDEGRTLLAAVSVGIWRSTRTTGELELLPTVRADRLADFLPVPSLAMARDSEELDSCVLTVHAHPDDEASKGASTVARYAAEGVRTVLVCCTGGEEGDILNPEMDRPEVRDDLHDVRLAELDQAAAIIGYEHVEMLGYRDSGMPDAEANAHPD